MGEQAAPHDPRAKALRVNLDDARYGSFAEIGAGQEVVRWFFQVGAAAGTIAKSMSAYDMTVSDAIYGPAPRYVSKARLEAMLEHEYGLTLERLAGVRGSSTAFFAFADTVTARGYRQRGDCHAWMGVRFQARPGEEPSQIILHLRLLDPENLQQQQALGVVGVNLVYGACYLAGDPGAVVDSLLDGLSTDRIEIDLIDFSGAAFRGIDNRVVGLRLVELGLAKATLFTPAGEVLQAADALYGRPVLVQRGRFRPPTLVNADMQRCALRRLVGEGGLAEEDVVSVLEMTLHELGDRGDIDLRDFLDRVDLLAGSKFTVLISDYGEYFRLAEYLARGTRERIRLVLGVKALEHVFRESYYEHLPGGILEAFGRLFQGNVRLYIYPRIDTTTGGLVTLADLPLAPELAKLHGYLVERGFLVPIEDFDRDLLPIVSDDVLRRLRAGDPSWKTMVPPQVVAVVEERSLFGPRAVSP